MKKKVLFVVTSLDVGGIEKYLLRFLEFSADKIHAYVLCKSGKVGLLENEFKKFASEIHTFKISYLNFITWIRFSKLLKANKFDTICDFTNDFAGVPIWFAFRAGIPVRISCYRSSGYRFKQTNIRRLYNKWVKKLVYKYSTKILFNSKAALDFFYPNENDGRFQIIYNGIETDQFLENFSRVETLSLLGVPENAFVIGHVGRYNEAKNYETIINTAKKLCDSHSNIYFLLVGKGIRENLTDIISKLGLEEKIIMPGVRKDVPYILKSINAFYFPSVVEGNPNSLLEAMAFSLPFVASDIPAIKEAVPKTFHRFLVDPFDHEKASNLLESFYLERNKDFDSLKDWVKDKFDSNSRLNEFYQVL